MKASKCNVFMSKVNIITCISYKLLKDYFHFKAAMSFCLKLI